ncbi:kinase-like domain-containing protein [Baffinella frigidus]|nr:kinase-like domain-containing protein [Cryptophyta sp. CCMP2293]
MPSKDVKPENILLTKASPICIRLADFGVATVASPSDLRALEDTEAIACSPGYGAPEIARQTRYSTPCDIWSTGITLVYLLQGRPPDTSGDIWSTGITLVYLLQGFGLQDGIPS